MTGSPHLAELWRYPVKSHGREEITRTVLTEGRTMPWDRRWAVAHEMAKLDCDTPEWAPCANFSRVAKAPRLAAISVQSNLRDQTVTFSYPRQRDLTVDLDDPDGQGAFIQWIMPLAAKDRALPSRIVRVPERGMTDTDYPSVSLINLASHAEVATKIGQPTSHLRWRGNLVMGGLAPFVERDWVGKRIRVGQAELEVRENITRCEATKANPDTGEKDHDTLGALRAGWGHQEFGVYAVVVKTGDVQQGDPIEVIG